jgi:hypothetical protein
VQIKDQNYTTRNYKITSSRTRELSNYSSIRKYINTKKYQEQFHVKRLTISRLQFSLHPSIVLQEKRIKKKRIAVRTY